MNVKYIFLGFWALLKQKIGIISKERKELYQKRLDICIDCPFLDDGFCDICGCYVKAKTKVDYDLDENRKSIEGCPQKYW
jgi:hypothetical protein